MESSAPAVKAPAIHPAATVHPVWLRVVHWTNALAVLLLITSGWRIFNASPLFGFTFPKALTIGGWLGGALQWHFAAMWLFAVNGLVYIVASLISGRWARLWWPLSPRDLWRDARLALRGRLSHAAVGEYNAVQKFAYASAVAIAVLLVLSGLVLWKSVQFPLLRDAMGGYEGARWVHFGSMAAMALFVAVHVVMATLVPRSLWAMFKGR